MRWVAFLLIAAATAAGVFLLTVPASGQGAGDAVPIFGITIPAGYRDWRFVSVAHEEGNLHSFAAILGNDVAIKAYRNGTLPFPDGTIIAALHFSHIPSEENNKVFGDPQSLIPDHLPTFNSWSRIQKNTRPPAAGDTRTSTKTVNLAPRRHSKPALPATPKLLATPYSPNTRPDTGYKTFMTLAQGTARRSVPGQLVVSPKDGLHVYRPLP